MPRKETRIGLCRRKENGREIVPRRRRWEMRFAYAVAASIKPASGWSSAGAVLRGWRSPVSTSLTPLPVSSSPASSPPESALSTRKLKPKPRLIHTSMFFYLVIIPRNLRLWN
ncbi:hypothetical protein SLEP1_g42183 [Rubroshorea leprosula]|uniref:Uncharacterized protein n=1 Tax=Rubroshorea leprosula TaxID=152421 RepID=A0AAV5L8Z9_9ROSI|nr:hypothetical protein SLEP1_g42183 [Rubroshorea leprosula]